MLFQPWNWYREHYSICIVLFIRLPLTSFWGYLIQHYVIKFFSVLPAGLWFSLSTPVSSTNKTDHHDITEILLKVALNTITTTNHSPEGIFQIFDHFFLSSGNTNEWIFFFFFFKRFFFDIDKFQFKML
jgi:hypothetical protein